MSTRAFKTVGIRCWRSSMGAFAFPGRVEAAPGREPAPPRPSPSAVGIRPAHRSSLSVRTFYPRPHKQFACAPLAEKMCSQPRRTSAFRVLSRILLWHGIFEGTGGSLDGAWAGN
eukprot:1976444-Rhodomonas_salina.1